MGSTLRRKNHKKIEKIADYFLHLCNAIINVILFMYFDAILGCDFLEKNIRFDAIAIPAFYKEVQPFVTLLPGRLFLTLEDAIYFMNPK